MTHPDIIIATYKTHAEVAPLVNEIEGFSYPCRVLATCLKASSPINRNAGLDWAQSEYVIMVDDDVAGFYEGWENDMIAPMLADPNIIMVSARLTNRVGENGVMMFQGDTRDQLSVVPRVPTACIAFHNTDLRFDENFEGSGFEDDDFHAQLSRESPYGKTVINNRVRLIHLNEQKEQGRYYAQNKAYFESKWLTTKDERRLDHTWNIPKAIYLFKGDGIVDIGPEMEKRNPEYDVVCVPRECIMSLKYEAVWEKSDPHSRRALTAMMLLLQFGGGWVTQDRVYRPLNELCRTLDLSTGALVLLDPDSPYPELIAAVRGSEFLRRLNSIEPWDPLNIGRVIEDSEKAKEHIVTVVGIKELFGDDLCVKT